MGKILLLMMTKTYRAGAFLEAAEKLDLPVVVGSEMTHVLAGMNPEGHLTLDFHDLEGSTDKIVEFAERVPLDAIVATEDDGVTLAAMASVALGLLHNAPLAVATARDKHLTRKAFATAGLNVPAFTRYPLDANPESIAVQTKYPSVVKPLALAGSRGVIRANDGPEFVSAWNWLIEIMDDVDMPTYADTGNAILVESYIPGDEVAVEGLLDDGDLTILAIFDKPDPLVGPYFEETIYVTPSRHPDDVQQAIRETTHQAVVALGLRDGPVHAEMRINDQGVWVLEVAPRSIGGYCSRALRFGDGAIGLEELILQHATGQSTQAPSLATPASGVMMIPIPERGILCAINRVDDAKSVPHVTEIWMTTPVGMEVIPPPEGARYLGFIFATGDTPEQVEAALREAHRRLEFVIEPAEK